MVDLNNITKEIEIFKKFEEKDYIYRVAEKAYGELTIEQIPVNRFRDLVIHNCSNGYMAYIKMLLSHEETPDHDGYTEDIILHLTSYDVSWSFDYDVIKKYYDELVVAAGKEMIKSQYKGLKDSLTKAEINYKKSQKFIEDNKERLKMLEAQVQQIEEEERKQKNETR